MIECTMTGGGHPTMMVGCIDAPDMLPSGGSDDGMTISMVFRDAADYDKWLNDDQAMMYPYLRDDFRVRSTNRVLRTS